MSDIPSLADVVEQHRWKPSSITYLSRCTGCGWKQEITNTGKTCIRLHAEHVQEVWFDTCTITTVERLATLKADPELLGGPVIKSFGLDLSKRGTGIGSIHEVGDDGMWSEGDDPSLPADQIPLPALLLWHHGWSA